MKPNRTEQKLLDAFATATPDQVDTILADCRDKKGVRTMAADRKTNNWKQPGQSRRNRIRPVAIAAAALALLLTGTVGGIIAYRHANAVEIRTNTEEIGSLTEQTVSVAAGTAQETVHAKTETANDGEIPTVTSEPVLSGSQQGELTKQQAEQIALKHAGIEAADTLIRKEKDDGIDVYEVEFYVDGVEYEYEIDTITGTIRKASLERKRFSDSSASAGAVTLEQAKEIALKHAGIENPAFLTGNTDRENGRDVFEVQFYANGFSYDYDIDQLTGMILSVSFELEDDDMGERESSDDQAGSVESGSYIGEAKAKEIALKDAGISSAAATFTKCHLDTEDGRTIYDIEFYTSEAEYDYEIDAALGKILGRDIEFDREQKTEQTNGSGNSTDIGTEKAKQIALKDAGLQEKDIKDLRCKKDSDDGIIIYEVDFTGNGYRYEYDIDAQTGKIRDKDVEAISSANTGSSSNADTSGSTDSKSYIGDTKAKSIALTNAGVSSSDAKNMRCKLEKDDGKWAYEIEFRAGGYEYEYEIDAYSGKILSKDKEKED